MQKRSSKHDSNVQAVFLSRWKELDGYIDAARQNEVLLPSTEADRLSHQLILGLAPFEEDNCPDNPMCVPPSDIDDGENSLSILGILSPNGPLASLAASSTTQGTQAGRPSLLQELSLPSPNFSLSGSRRPNSQADFIKYSVDSMFFQTQVLAPAAFDFNSQSALSAVSPTNSVCSETTQDPAEPTILMNKNLPAESKLERPADVLALQNRLQQLSGSLAKNPYGLSLCQLALEVLARSAPDLTLRELQWTSGFSPLVLAWLQPEKTISDNKE